MIWIGARWPSTWSRSAWESSSTIKTADSGQYLRDLVDRLGEVVVCDLGTRPGGPQVAQMNEREAGKGIRRSGLADRPMAFPISRHLPASSGLLQGNRTGRSAPARPAQVRPVLFTPNRR
jgi:hypothetical protein